MARGFGTTSGAGATDIIQTTFTGGLPAKSSWFAWVWDDGTGGTGTFGRLFDSNSQLLVNWNNVSSYTITVSNWSILHGVWFADTAGTLQWNTWGFSYDSTSPSNNPTVYANQTKGTPSGSPQPQGTFTNNTDPLDIGNRRSDSARNWGGRLAHVAIWNVILTDAEFFAMGLGALPFTIRPKALQAYWPIYGNVSPEPDLSGFAKNGTVTGTTNVFGPPTTLYTPRWQGFFLPEPPPSAASMVFSQQTISIPLLMTVPISVTLHNP